MRSSDSPARRWRIGAAALALVLLAVPLASRAGTLFLLDQRYGSIAFTVSNLGLFRSHGGFARFIGRLTLDAADPTATKISVTVAADSLRTPWAQETEMLRSVDFFDVARYKEIRFESQAVRPTGPGTYAITGQLTLRGLTRPIILSARLMHATSDKATGQQVNDFVVTGSVSRKEFGMVADPLFIADQVAIDIHARIMLAPSASPPAHGS